MKLRFLFLALTLDAHSNVVELTDETFADFINDYSVVVKFYAPESADCKKLAPMWDKLADSVNESMTEIKVAKVDCTLYNEICTEYIEDFPTLTFFRKGWEKPQKYEGKKDLDALLSYLRRGMLPVRKAILDAEIERKTLRIRRKNFTDEHTKFAVKYFNDIEVEHEESEDEETVILHPRQGPIKFNESEETLEALETFYIKNQFPLWGEIDEISYEGYYESGREIVWFLFNLSAPQILDDIVNDHREAVQEVAREFPNMAFTYTDTEEYGAVLETLLAVKQFPVVVYQDNIESRKKFHFTGSVFLDTGDINKDGIIEFLKKVAVGELTSVMSSEEVPETQDGPVYKVVGSTLKKVMMDPDRDVLLEIYDPDDPECEKFASAFAEVAEKVETIGLGNTLRFAQMNVNLNDSPLESIPEERPEEGSYLYYSRANSQEIIQFPLAQRNVAGLWAFILANHSANETLKAAYEEASHEEERSEL